MKSLSSGLASLTSAFGLLTLNFAIALPAQASIVCQAGTMNKYQNGSLASCVLAQDTNVQVSSLYAGTYSFPCKAKNFILFDDQGQFKSCWLAVDIKIKKGNSIETCPAEYNVDVAIANDGSLSIFCRR
ncbi:MAG: hypothetical protein KME23_03160 [Goleter apudmare HA4340-LM2]|jgi:hypothetical protein|nr:hypothetical protein [Goleter apudmare HA4340-LM2]